MEAQRWQQAQSIFAATADLAPAEKTRAHVRDLCGDDDELAACVFGMLEQDARQNALLDADVSSVIGEIAQASLDTDHLRSLVQRQIGPYRLLRVLGEGGMGIVYLAERTDIGGLVAIKLLRDAWLSPMRRERFHLEQKTLARLNHPGIARIYDANTMEDGTPWFVMEFADGRPFTDFVRERAGTVRDDLLLFASVCLAVEYAHSHAIIHRDLKPSNILVTAKGEVKLLDFGIAKQMETEPAEAGRTVAGLRLLSPGYAAPEQYEGSSVGVFTDVYSLGVLLYETLTGHLPGPADLRPARPIERPSTLARRSKHHAGTSHLGQREWSELDVICMTALQAEPNRRYRSVDALFRDVTAFLEGRVLEAKPASLAYIAGKFIRRNRWPLLAAAVACAVLAAAAITFTVRLAEARNAAVAEAARTRQIQRFMLNMSGDADAEAGPAKELTVVSLLDREARQSDALGSDPRTQIELDQTIGSMYNRLGKYEESQRILTRALDRARKVEGPGSIKTAEVLVQLGTLLGDRGDTAGAQQDLAQALDLAKSNRLRPGSETVVQARIALARIDLQSGKYQHALETLTPLTQEQTGTEGSLYDRRDALASLAVANLGLQHYDQAEAASRSAIALDRSLLGEGHVQTAIDLINLGSIEATRRNLVDAEALYREGIRSMTQWYGADSPDVAAAQSILARTLLGEHKDAEAETILHQVLPVEERAYGPVHERVALILVSLGELALRHDDLRTAETDLSRARQIYRSALGDANPHTAAVECTLGTVYLRQGRTALAETTERRAVDVIATLPPGNNLIGVARARWGRTLLAMKRYPEAEQQLTAASQIMKGQQNPAAEVAHLKDDLASLALRFPSPRAEAIPAHRN